MQTKHAALIVTLALAPFAVVQAQQSSPGGQSTPTQTQPKGGGQGAGASSGGSTKSAAGSQMKSGALSSSDRDFIMKAATDGQKEVAVAEVAESKASSPSVKSLAERLEKDHTQANNELQSLAQSKNVTLPPAKDHAADTAKWQKMEGAGFDRAYANQMVNDHKAAISLFEKASKSSDPEIKAFADKTLPTLREHLSMAQQAAGGVAGTSGMSKPGASGSSGTAPKSKPDASAPHNTPQTSSPK